MSKAIVIVATVGFTTDFVMRRLYSLGRNNVPLVVAVALDAGDNASKRRVEQAYSLLSGFLKSIGVGSRLEWVRYGPGMVARGRDILFSALSEANGGYVDLFLTGGPRILVVTMLLSAITLPRDLARRIEITSYGEAFEASLSVRAETVIELASLRGDPDRRILEEVAARSKKGPVQASELLEALGIPRSTLYKKLRELELRGLVEKRPEGWIVPSHVETLL